MKDCTPWGVVGKSMEGMTENDSFCDRSKGGNGVREGGRSRCVLIVKFVKSVKRSPLSRG